jgi:gluconate 2-dehydrogenase gamma chain
MSQNAIFSRRKFMQIAVVATAAGPIVSCIGTSNPWRFLSEDEARTLEALCDRIIPADQEPGAVWAGAVNFIDRQLVGPYRKFQKTYRQGLTGANKTSLAMFGKRVAALTGDQADEVLRKIENEQAPGDKCQPLPVYKFFDLVLNHTMQAFYGDPRHGGNRERVSWKMLRLPYPPVRGRLEYDLTKTEARS